MIKLTWDTYTNTFYRANIKITKKLDLKFNSNFIEALLFGRYDNGRLINHRRIIMNQSGEHFKDNSNTVGYYE